MPIRDKVNTHAFNREFLIGKMIKSFINDNPYIDKKDIADIRKLLLTAMQCEYEMIHEMLRNLKNHSSKEYNLEEITEHFEKIGITNLYDKWKTYFFKDELKGNSRESKL